jgi:hypothetical protein
VALAAKAEPSSAAAATADVSFMVIVVPPKERVTFGQAQEGILAPNVFSVKFFVYKMEIIACRE